MNQVVKKKSSTVVQKPEIRQQAQETIQKVAPREVNGLIEVRMVKDSLGLFHVVNPIGDITKLPADIAKKLIEKGHAEKI